ncbi:DUF1156 domain-containing protein [Bosea sp. TND4EK4]|uniref:DUF1156 domain-containing protein n=1 Tax=Bosea sp. TND4EK4 TaxID=1907408 RepID=UPI0009707A78|nr:DUF1156 domain-containing protein [Bosea sp. TND4EK4]
MTDARLIERWLPIAAIGEESVRERRSMTALPPVYYLHVWWARRPLVASRAALLASLLPAEANHADFLQALGIHGDPVNARARMDAAIRNGVRIENPYDYDRAFTYQPSKADIDVIHKHFGCAPVVIDPTAGGGSIPFEAARLGCNVISNDLNPVAALIQKATIEYPIQFGPEIKPELARISNTFKLRIKERLDVLFPQSARKDETDITYLWARTITCPYCDGRVPLSPNWRLAPNGTGVRLHPKCEGGPTEKGRVCDFEIVNSLEQHSEGTVADGTGTCPFPDCARVIDGDDIKRQAQAGGMGEQLYAVVFKRRMETRTKSGKRGKDKWVRGYRSPTASDDNLSTVMERLAERIQDWQVLDLIPNEAIPDGLKTTEPHRYGMRSWTDLFAPRQLIGHCTAVEVFREILSEEEAHGLSDLTRTAFVYLALSLDKMLNYNSRMSVWMSTREIVANTFNRHDFAFCWSYAEMASLVDDLGYDWAVEQTTKCIGELVKLTGGGIEADLLSHVSSAARSRAEISITCGSGDNLTHVADASVDVVVMDPPYYDNVMYAELSDFFYVWLKRTAGQVLPQLFTRRLTDKENEAVANPAKFRDQKGAKALAGRDYQERMARIFEECRRVLKPNGVMTLMFTHKATGAWDALTSGLMQAGFTISASWPINTEAEGSLHIKDKSAANSTIFLVCRPRQARIESDASYWEDVEPLVASAVRKRVSEFQSGGIAGVDLYLASFGPALEELSKHWPLKRGTPRAEPASRKRRKQADIFDEVFDPYAVSPEDALEAARREVKTWRLNQLMHMRGKDDLDPATSWFVLAWDAFKAPVFAYDEGLRLARAVGADLDSLVGRLCEKKGSDLRMWDSATRAAKGSLGAADGSRGMIDVIHQVANQIRTRSVECPPSAPMAQI